MSNLWGSGLTGSNSPNWLVSDNDVGPVFALLSDGVELSIIDVLSLTGLSLLEELTDASEDGETIIDSNLGLLGDILISLAEEGSSLGVTGESVLDAHVLDHASGEFSGEGTVTSEGQVLGGHMHVVLED